MSHLRVKKKKKRQVLIILKLLFYFSNAKEKQNLDPSPSQNKAIRLP